MMAVEARGITKVYGTASAEVWALRGIDLAISVGSFVAIMGPSGSGKSTLLATLGGLDSPTNGNARIGGQWLGGLPESELAIIRREKIGFVFQSFNLIPVLSAEENVAVPLLLAGKKGTAIRARVERIMELVGLSDRRAHLPTELSGGQQQRVAIARALVIEPALVLADEPTGNLDSHSSREILTILRRSCDEFGRTVVLVTHDSSVAAWADRVLFLRDGLIVADQKCEGTLTERTQTISRRLEEVVADA